MVVSGKYIDFRSVEEEDSLFIFSLRSDRKKRQYLSSIDGGVDAQREWIRRYKEREEAKLEYYFVIESKESERLGLVRLYDFEGDSFCWGSWIIKDDAPKSTAIKSALQVYQFAFYQLDFLQSNFEVRRGNEKVISFHQRFGAKIVGSNEKEYLFNFTKEDYDRAKIKYKRYI